MTLVSPFDVAARLAEGRPAVDDVQEYVAACQRLGYQHQDLTAHSGQVRDWYDSEHGLDLRVLDADCAVLAAVAAAASDACRIQTDLVTELSMAWSGGGASAAREFVGRSNRAASSVAMSVGSAADAAATLRDALWRAVDEKVVAVTTIDGRHGDRRAQWLAAARTVTSGAGDLAAASEMIDQQVKPFVHNDISSDWLEAMRAAVTSVDTAYTAAISRMTGGPAAVFEVPGELGPRATPSDPGAVADTRAAPSSPVQTIPAAAVVSGPMPSAAPIGTPSGPAPAPWTGPPTGVPPPAAPSMSGPGDLGGGTSSLGNGLSGFGQQLADVIGGLVGSGDGLAEIDDPDDLGDVGESGELDGRQDEPEVDECDESTPEQAADEEPEETDLVQTAPEPEPAPDPDEIPTPTPAPMPADPPPVPQAIPEPVAEPAEPTPCAIAADELPQVGE